MRADSQVYTLDNVGVPIRGGTYVFMANAAAALSIQLPDQSWAPLSVLYGNTTVSLAAAGAVTPIELGACTVRSSIASGSWLAGVG